MLSLNLSIGQFHPAVMLAIAEAIELPEGNDACQHVLARMEAKCAEIIDEGKEKAELDNRISEKSKGKGGSKSWTLTLRGKMAGITLPDSPAGLLVRLNNYLESSRELYLRIDSVTLPASVVSWAKAVHETLQAATEKAKAETEKVHA